MNQDNLSKTFRSIIKSSPASPAEIVQHLLGLCGKAKWQLSNTLGLSPQTASIIYNTSAPTPGQEKRRLEIARILSSWLSGMMGTTIDIRSEDIWPQPSENAGTDQEQAAA